MTAGPADRMPHGKHPDLRVRDAALFNAGPPPALLGGEIITPTELFFARSHGLVPTIDPTTWVLRIGGLVEQSLELTLRELQRDFPRSTVAATLVCAGLRRDELMAVRAIPGELPWGLEPVSTGSFCGVALRDVLRTVGVSAAASHVGFVGLDEVSRKNRTFGFGGSIPLTKALSSEVLLAFEMNGEPLPAVHGGPVRVVVPGYIGARSVKWLGEVELRAAPSENYFQAEAYRMQREVRGGDARDVSAGEALAELPLNAVILVPAAEGTLRAGLVEASGWACGAAGHPPARVEVSSDDGVSWKDATVDSSGGEWTWVFWRASLMLAPGRHTLVVRAWDRDGPGQPAALAAVWNLKGYANNAWHRVPVEVSA